MPFVCRACSRTFETPIVLRGHLCVEQPQHRAHTAWIQLDSTPHGIAAFATQSIATGQTVIQQQPLLQFQSPRVCSAADRKAQRCLERILNESSLDSFCSDVAVFAAALLAYLALPPADRLCVLSLYHVQPEPESSAAENPALAAVSRAASRMSEWTAARGDLICASDLVTLILVIESNNTSDCLFSLHARVQHSCNPNTRFYITSDGSVKHLALRAIQKYEQVTMSYSQRNETGSCYPMLPHHLRRKQITLMHQFLCCCDRCEARDSVRTFGCGSCCGNISHCQDPSTGLWGCAHCGTQMDNASYQLEKESKMTRAVQQLMSHPSFSKSAVGLDILTDDGHDLQRPNSVDLDDLTKMRDDCFGCLGSNHWTGAVLNWVWLHQMCFDREQLNRQRQLVRDREQLKVVVRTLESWFEQCLPTHPLRAYTALISAQVAREFGVVLQDSLESHAVMLRLLQEQD